MQHILKPRAIFLCLLVFFSTQYSFSQSTLLKETLLKSRVKTTDSSTVSDIANSLFHNGALDYLKPLRGLLLKDSSAIKKEDFSRYLEHVGQVYSYIGDVDNAALHFWLRSRREKSNKFATNPQAFKAYKQHQLADILNDVGSKNQLLMFNEAHHVPLQRVFVASLLPQLKTLGFNYLALEALGAEVKPGLSLAWFGSFTKDPQMSNLIAYAKSLGFNLVRYEPEYSPGYNRDSLQAENILNVIRKDPKAKIVVLAGYGHMQEGFHFVKRFKPMGTFIKEISNINPVTISLLNFNSYTPFEEELPLYKQLIKTFKPEKPVILTRDYPADASFKEGYDYYVLFPEYGATTARPEWLALNRHYKKLKVKPISHFQLIQAYKSIQGKTNSDIAKDDVPADQCYISNKQLETYLYLFPGSYKIVYRDINYKVIKSFNANIK